LRVGCKNPGFAGLNCKPPMSWLFPLYLLGAGAILAPILMHLHRRPPQERVEFSSLMFLQARTPEPTRKRRIEHWLLLLLRCLALLLLALMFSRPWLQDDARAAAGAGRAVLILVDRSASMRRADLMAQAVARARAEVQAATPQDRVALAAFDATLQPLWTFEQDAGANGRAGLVQQLDALRPGWQATDLGRSLVDALGLLAGSSGLAGREQRLVIITDLQEGTRLDALRGVAWPEQVRVQLLRIEAPEAGNFSLSLAAAEPEAGSAQPSLRVRVTNTREAATGDFTLRWEKAGGEVVTGQVPPGTTRLLRMPLPDRLTPEGDTLRLEGDGSDFDNRVFFAPAPARPVRVAWLGPTTGADEAASPLYYLRRALQPTPALQPEVVQNGASGLAGARLAVLHGAPPPAELGDWLRAGGFGVWLLEPGTAAAAIETLTGVPGWSVTEAQSDDYRMLGGVKEEHPLLQPFADPRLRDFTKLRFWKHRRLTLGDEAARRVEVLARFDNGDPALLALPVGAGTLVLLTSGWQPADSQLALSTKFVPLLFGWLEAAGFAHAEASGLSVGDTLPPVETATIVVTPEGREIARAPGAAQRTESVGLYQLKTGDGSRWHAVQLTPAEGRTSPMAAERLADFGVRLETAGTATEAASAAQVQERLAAGEAEERQQAWWWILVALLAVLGAETLLASRSARPERSTVVPT
jgi:hypothetical protein